jgi:hypothetical protein
MVLCKCGCGEEVKEGNTYIRGHHKRGKEYWKSQEKPKLCECGCGEYAKPGNRFIQYHHVRGDNYKKIQQGSQLCKCGCGKYANSGREFINGHQYRNAVPLKGENHPNYKPEIDIWIKENTNKHLCKCGCCEYIIIRRDHYWAGIPKYIPNHYNTVQPPTKQETKDKISESNTGKIRTKEMRDHASIMTTKYFEDITNREKASAKAQGISYDEWEDFVRNSLYCPKFDEFCRESNREKFGRMCFLTSLPEEENITSTGKQQKLSVHHVDMDKTQGCDGKRWKLVPLCLKWHKIAHTKLWIARITWLLNNVWNKNIGIINDT